jgi:hypothetical protein
VVRSHQILHIPVVRFDMLDLVEAPGRREGGDFRFEVGDVHLFVNETIKRLGNNLELLLMLICQCRELLLEGAAGLDEFRLAALDGGQFCGEFGALGLGLRQAAPPFPDRALEEGQAGADVRGFGVYGRGKRLGQDSRRSGVVFVEAVLEHVDVLGKTVVFLC